jgi:hypothetical protein
LDNNVIVFSTKSGQNFSLININFGRFFKLSPNQWAPKIYRPSGEISSNLVTPRTKHLPAQLDQRQLHGQTWASLFNSEAGVLGML